MEEVDGFVVRLFEEAVKSNKGMLGNHETEDKVQIMSGERR